MGFDDNIIKDQPGCLTHAYIWLVVRRQGLIYKLMLMTHMFQVG